MTDSVDPEVMEAAIRLRGVHVEGCFFAAGFGPGSCDCVLPSTIARAMQDLVQRYKDQLRRAEGFTVCVNEGTLMDAPCGICVACNLRDALAEGGTK